MYFCGFQLHGTQGEELTRWVPAEALTALLCADAHAAAQLLQAVHRFNPLHGQSARVNVEPGSPHAEIARKAKFHIFRKEEIEDLHWAAFPQAKERTSAFEALSGISLPRSVGVMVSQTHANEYLVEFDEPLGEGLDVARARTWILENLPLCSYVDGFSLFSGRADLALLGGKDPAALSVDERTALGLLRAAGLKPGETPAPAALAAIATRLGKYFDQSYPGGPVRFSLRTNGSLLDLFVELAGSKELVHLRDCSAWLRWSVTFFSQLAGATAGNKRDCIMLLESFGAQLYPGQHAQLLDYFNQLTFYNSVLYTTQLASLIDLTRPERTLALANDGRQGGLYVVPYRDPAYPKPILQQAFGISPEAAVVARSRPTLIVSDLFSAEILRGLSSAIQRAGAESLSDQIFIQSCGGPKRAPFFAQFAAAQWTKAGMLFDTDKNGEALSEKIRKAAGAGFTSLLMGDAAAIEQNEATIEDLFPTDFFLDCVSSAYGKKFAAGDLPSEGSDSIGKRVSATAQKLKVVEKKTELLLPELLKRFAAITDKSGFPEGTFEKASALFASANSAFGLKANSGSPKRK